MSEIGRITVLVDNCVQGRGLLAEHGLACWVEVRARRLLFDTGQGRALRHNAEHLGVPLRRTEAVALSHGHYDHTGGLDQVLELAPHATVYAHPAVLEHKYARGAGANGREIGIPSKGRARLASAGGPAAETAVRLHPTAEPTEIGDGVFVTGEIPRRTAYEDTGGSFFTDRGGASADPLIDDQALFVESRTGTVVVLGCAHAGVINTLLYVRELTGGKPVHAVLGGMHLLHASRERMERTIEALRELDIPCLAPGHCTGPSAIAELWSALPRTCRALGAGARLEFELP